MWDRSYIFDKHIFLFKHKVKFNLSQDELNELSWTYFLTKTYIYIYIYTHIYMSFSVL